MRTARQLLSTALIAVLATTACDGPNAHEELQSAIGGSAHEAARIQVVEEGPNWRIVAFRTGDELVCTAVIHRAADGWENRHGTGCNPGEPEGASEASFDAEDADGQKHTIWWWLVPDHTHEIHATVSSGASRPVSDLIKLPVRSVAESLPVHIAVVRLDGDSRVVRAVGFDQDGSVVWQQ